MGDKSDGLSRREVLKYGVCGELAAGKEQEFSDQEEKHFCVGLTSRFGPIAHKLECPE
jgi:hypothetical protein